MESFVFSKTRPSAETKSFRNQPLADFFEQQEQQSPLLILAFQNQKLEFFLSCLYQICTNATDF